MGDLVITPTEYSHELIRSYGLPGRVHVLSNGVDTQFFAPDDGAGRDFRRRHGISQQAQLVVSAGLQIARKGILDWIELARSRPDVEFWWFRSEEHTSELQSRFDLVCRLLLEKKNTRT